MDERLERARLGYERSVFGGDPDALPGADHGLDSLEADLALARGRVMHARFLDRREEDPRELELFDRAATLYAKVGDPRGEAAALFWKGAFHQVVRADATLAVPLFERSLDLATRAGDKLTMSYALRHLGMAEHVAGRPDAARGKLTESTRLRRELDFVPGIAANLVGLAHLAIDTGRTGEARELLDEAAALAARSRAHGMTRMVEEARQRLVS
ncbi:MAG: tetratricopeptide repeat protein [Actinophytocola sp.]|uniref:hypothetical protein n=1 Tax=Actinophytocola sp. TaxID=1872138 RepID=UPI001322376A|nr:hypothetical protein [Actinophytocola sp.]MPZ84248.1 tetratricopeptide repeat protein [Actinophytocola sp.]